MAKKVLILSAKAGAGHIRAADAIAEAFRLHHPEVQVEHIEALANTNWLFSRAFTNGYNLLAGRWPRLWGLLFELTDETSQLTFSRKLATFLDQVNSRPLARLVRQKDPDAVICTHYLPPEVLAPMRLFGKMRGRLYSMITDYDAHALWLFGGVDKYFVATPETAASVTFRTNGTPVSVTGIPIMSDFSQEYPSRMEMRKRMGLRPEPKTAIVAAGGFGLSRVDQTVALLAEEVSDVQIVALAGRNKKLFESLKEVAVSHHGRIVPLEYTTRMHDYMAASDLIVSKAGGLTTSECLAMGVPLIVFNPIPGQEERNMHYLLEHGAALYAHGVAHLAYKFKLLIENDELLQRMKTSATQIGRPHAAKQIADEVLAEIS